MNERFKYMLFFLKKTETTLARELNVSRNTITKITGGTNQPSSKVLVPLAEKLNININWLLLGVGEMFINPPITDTKNISGDVGFLQIGDDNKNEKINIKSNKDNTYHNVKSVESLIQQLKEKDKQIAAKDEVIRSKDEIIRSKDEIIHLLKNK
ncbi:helix-turn-helix transcriptional regulator [Aureispira sp. CCB-E]|uniref:helix-turn-helix domain-containing protein n=1 Tax=Aureispira sp. CCB-E TaxID=3051121 RepID=UPI0028695884|nr:helix-turn-helix transcriptional regulator [Aureispira sp. CCB-E]WMX16537.1 helix-turn-helix transcriptional regulator [Aureispira sp. CCB-E]